MKRKKYQMPGRDEPFTIEDGRIEVKGFKNMKLYSTWQAGIICYSGYPLETKKKLRVLTFSVN